MINPPSILKMRVERDEAAWLEFMFEFKSQSNQAYADWVMKVLAKCIKQNREGRHQKSRRDIKDLVSA